MYKVMTAAIAVATLGVTGAQAGEVTGGSLGLSYSSFSDGDFGDKTSIEGSVEFGITRNIAVQADLAHHRAGEIDLNSTNIGLHGIYHMDEMTSFGAFVVREDTNSGNIDYIGLEAGYDAGIMDFEGYLARADIDSEDGTLIGLSGRYEFANSVGLTVGYDRADVDVLDISVFSAGLDADVSPNLNLFVEAGVGKVAALGFSETDAFMGIGGKYAFGAKRGATFEQRGFTSVLPGL